MTRRIAVLVALPAFLGFQTLNHTFAQEKKLPTFEQIFNNAEPRILQEIPDITGWADDDHYVRRGQKQGGTGSELSAVDVRTGREEPYRDMRGFRELVGEGIDLS